jgi:transglutaminase-like putative cysteine protease
MPWTGGLLCAFVGAALAGRGPAYVTEEGPPRRYEAELTLKLHAPQLAVKEWVVFAARPPSLAGQEVKAAGLEPGGKADHERSAARRPVLRARLSVADAAPQQGVALRAHYEVELRERRLVEAGRAEKPAPAAAPDPEERKLALAATKRIAFRAPEFRKWLEKQGLRRRDGEHAVDLARRAYLAVVKNFGYDFHPDMERRPDATCRAGKSDCAGLSIVFVAALRANDVPARLRVGRWARSQGENDHGQAHVIAEFYAPGAGWVQADCTGGVLHDRTPGRLRYFGRFRADFITLHLDDDLVLDTEHFGKRTVLWLQKITFWVAGRGALTGLTEKEDWRVRQLP